MSHQYEVERAELKIKIFNLREKVANMQTVQHSKDMFIGAVKKFLDMDTITAPLIHELIDHIDVYEAEGKGKNKTQRGAVKKQPKEIRDSRYCESRTFFC